MPQLTDAQIAQVAHGAGFRGDDTATAVAVALAESGGISDRVNDQEPDGSISRGLWQINSVHSDLLQSGDWQNPTDNARMAFIIHQRRGWLAWGAFTNLSYRLFLVRGIAAAKEVGEETPGLDPEGSLIPDPLAPAKDALRNVETVFRFFTDRHMWLRLFVTSVGLVLLLVIIARLVSDSPAGSTAGKLGKVAIKAVPGGKMLS